MQSADAVVAGATIRYLYILRRNRGNRAHRCLFGVTLHLPCSLQHVESLQSFEHGPRSHVVNVRCSGGTLWAFSATVARFRRQGLQASQLQPGILGNP